MKEPLVRKMKGRNLSVGKRVPTYVIDFPSPPVSADELKSLLLGEDSFAGSQCCHHTLHSPVTACCSQRPPEQHRGGRKAGLKRVFLSEASWLQILTLHLPLYACFQVFSVSHRCPWWFLDNATALGIARINMLCYCHWKLLRAYRYASKAVPKEIPPVSSWLLSVSLWKQFHPLITYSLFQCVVA